MNSSDLEIQIGRLEAKIERLEFYCKNLKKEVALTDRWRLLAEKFFTMLTCQYHPVILASGNRQVHNEDCQKCALGRELEELRRSVQPKVL